MQDGIFYCHIASLTFVAWNVFRADHMGFSWIQGKTERLTVSEVKKYHYRTLTGLMLMILTGLLLFWPAKDYLLTRIEFWIKMGFVIALIINSFVIGTLSNTAVTKTFSSLTTKEKTPLFITGAVSTICWLGAATMAFFLF